MLTRATEDTFLNGVPVCQGGIAPGDELSERGLNAGDEVDGVRFASNGCPSRGTIDVFVEPCLPRPELVIFGASPVAQALTDLAGRFDWDITALSGQDTLLPASAGLAFVD